ncbi:MAG TPA: efflux RND transporter periplasmic adaptor subunit [Bryobacteraceae bacterium]|nr:efflux RND transporter periplasmic adaptor subunit [Bryobacteraceae bacterium]
MKSVILVLVTLAVGFAGGYSWMRWHGTSPQRNAPTDRKVLYWVDPMHPAYKSDKPGIAPDCGMKLEPVYADDNKPAEEAPSGTIQVSAEKQQLIGVTYGTASYTTKSETIRTVGRVAQDETRLTRVHPRIEGWISKTFVDYTGQLVHKGDPLLTLYSPDMLASEQELLLALRARDQMKAGPMKEAWGNSEMLLEATRRRLELFDLSRPQIEQIERTRTPIESITLYSPATGYVVARNAYPSQRVTPETELYTLSDLSRVWIMADAFEADIARIREGQGAEVTASSGEIAPFHARVTWIQPQIDPQTRTMKVRLEADNPGMRLKPDMFVNVQFPLSAAPKLTVPANAVMDSGARQTVYVDRGNGYLEPRAVQIGERLGDRIEIVSGLRPDERIVTSGTFLIDSETRLKQAASALEHPND